MNKWIWLTIDTAPKDETFALLYFPTLLPEEGKYKLGFWSEGDADWFDSEAASRPLTAFGHQPTHWAALEPPEDLIPVYAMKEKPTTRNALQEIGEIAVPPNATAEEVMAVVREIQAIAAMALK